MLSSGTKCCHLGLNVIIWDAMLSSGANAFICDEMLSSGMKCYHMLLMLSSGTKCYHLELMLSSGTKFYHLGWNVIIWNAMLSCNAMLSFGANVVMLSFGANVIIWCYHVMLSSGMITPPFFIFPENFTHSNYSTTKSFHHIEQLSFYLTETACRYRRN
jgi:hypothetical protein